MAESSDPSDHAVPKEASGWAQVNIFGGGYKLYLEGLDLGGDLRLLLADQAGDQVVMFHGPILGTG